MKARHILRPRRIPGFSLIELMVGVAIGMIAIVVVMQTLLTSDAGKRLEASGNDATTAGALATSALLRDMRQAGQGFSNQYLLGCQLTLSSGHVLSSLAPVTINPTGIPAGDANTDTVLVVYGNGNGSPDGDSVTSQSSQSVYTVATPYSFTSGDELVARPIATSAPPSCALSMEAVQTVDNGSSQVTVSTGVASMLYGTVFDLGQAPKALVYAVRNGSLTVCDYMSNDCSNSATAGDSTIWVPVADNIVSLRAQYGRDTNAGTMTGVVDTYDQTTPGTTCDWYRIPVVRFVVVARASQYDKDPSYTFDPASLAWAGATSSTPIAVDVTGIANYQHYHYKMYQSTVPLRNIGWQGAQSGC